MNSRQQLIIQLGADYVAATVGRKNFDIIGADPDEIAAHCFALAVAVANQIRAALHANAGPEPEGEALPIPKRH